MRLEVFSPVLIPKHTSEQIYILISFCMTVQLVSLCYMIFQKQVQVFRSWHIDSSQIFRVQCQACMLRKSLKLILICCFSWYFCTIILCTTVLPLLASRDLSHQSEELINLSSLEMLDFRNLIKFKSSQGGAASFSFQS